MHIEKFLVFVGFFPDIYFLLMFFFVAFLLLKLCRHACPGIGEGSGAWISEGWEVLESISHCGTV